MLDLFELDFLDSNLEVHRSRWNYVASSSSVVRIPPLCLVVQQMLLLQEQRSLKKMWQRHCYWFSSTGIVFELAIVAQLLCYLWTMTQGSQEGGSVETVDSMQMSIMKILAAMMSTTARTEKKKASEKWSSTKRAICERWNVSYIQMIRKESKHSQTLITFRK